MVVVIGKDDDFVFFLNCFRFFVFSDFNFFFYFFYFFLLFSSSFFLFTISGKEDDDGEENERSGTTIGLLQLEKCLELSKEKEIQSTKELVSVNHLVFDCCFMIVVLSWLWLCYYCVIVFVFVIV